jgi:hypothetical protein
MWLSRSESHDLAVRCDGDRGSHRFPLQVEFFVKMPVASKRLFGKPVHTLTCSTSEPDRGGPGSPALPYVDSKLLHLASQGVQGLRRRLDSTTTSTGITRTGTERRLIPVWNFRALSTTENYQAHVLSGWGRVNRQQIQVKLGTSIRLEAAHENAQRHRQLSLVTVWRTG